jgi:hypothetical protein
MTNDELVTIWMEAVVTSSTSSVGICLKGSRKPTGIKSQTNWCPVRDSKQAPLEYKSTVLELKLLNILILTWPWPLCLLHPLDLHSANGNPLHLQLAFFRIEQSYIAETRLERSGYSVMAMLRPLSGFTQFRYANAGMALRLNRQRPLLQNHSLRI